MIDRNKEALDRMVNDYIEFRKAYEGTLSADEVLKLYEIYCRSNDASYIASAIPV